MNKRGIIPAIPKTNFLIEVPNGAPSDEVYLEANWALTKRIVFYGAFK